MRASRFAATATNAQNWPSGRSAISGLLMFLNHNAEKFAALVNSRPYLSQKTHVAAPAPDALALLGAVALLTWLFA